MPFFRCWYGLRTDPTRCGRPAAHARLPSLIVITPLGTDGKLRITNRGSAADVRAVVDGFHR